MKLRFKGILTGVLLLVAASAWAVAPQSSEATKTAVQAIQKAGDKITSFEADQSISMDMMGMPMKLSGKMQVLKPDYMKMDMSADLSQKPGDTPDPAAAMQASMMNMNMVMNDTAVFVYMPAMNMVTRFDKSVYKDIPGMASPSQQMGGDPTKALDQLDPNSISLVGEELLDGQTCYVIEGKLPDTAKQMGAPFVPESMKLWIAKEDGLPRKTEAFTSEGVSMMTVLMKNVKVNVNLSKEDFAFTPPAGAQVMDMTDTIKNMMPKTQEEKPERTPNSQE